MTYFGNALNSNAINYAQPSRLASLAQGFNNIRNNMANVALAQGRIPLEAAQVGLTNANTKNVLFDLAHPWVKSNTLFGQSLLAAGSPALNKLNEGTTTGTYMPQTSFSPGITNSQTAGEETTAGAYMPQTPQGAYMPQTSQGAYMPQTSQGTYMPQTSQGLTHIANFNPLVNAPTIPNPTNNPYINMANQVTRSQMAQQQLDNEVKLSNLQVNNQRLQGDTQNRTAQRAAGVGAEQLNNAYNLIPGVVESKGDESTLEFALKTLVPNSPEQSAFETLRNAQHSGLLSTIKGELNTSNGNALNRFTKENEISRFDDTYTLYRKIQASQRLVNAIGDVRGLSNTQLNDRVSNAMNIFNSGIDPHKIALKNEVGNTLIYINKKIEQNGGTPISEVKFLKRLTKEGYTLE